MQFFQRGGGKNKNGTAYLLCVVFSPLKPTFQHFCAKETLKIVSFLSSENCSYFNNHVYVPCFAKVHAAIQVNAAEAVVRLVDDNPHQFKQS